MTLTTAQQPPSTASNISRLSMEIAEHCVLVPLNNPPIAHPTRPFRTILHIRIFPSHVSIGPTQASLPCRPLFLPDQLNLRCLLLEVVITEVKLLACLAAVPSLQRLSVADHHAISSAIDETGVNQHLITNSLPSTPIGSLHTQMVAMCAPALTSSWCQFFGISVSQANSDCHPEGCSAA
ncbi:hypothetical protein FB45DRAFT_1021826 [Roridomyces roridus]|uniref:Uncharacterized protein n=1 Tax=Roridomyces roridus TaxID=1738132 RepID=A0AAD7FV52_9AGAR|nr:hypothetical protein FB45DRAFT_1021826 [Roridomyces roridus]